MAKRAATLGDLIVPHLPDRGRILDVGSGTGHMAAFLERECGWQVVECDVVDFSTRPASRPIRFDGSRLPFRNDAFGAALLLFSLHYAADPSALLEETRRVARSCIVLHTTAVDPSKRPLLRRVEFLEGRLAFSLARCLGLIPPTRVVPLQPLHLLSRADLDAHIRRTGFEVRARESYARKLRGLTFELRSLA